MREGGNPAHEFLEGGRQRASRCRGQEEEPRQAGGRALGMGRREKWLNPANPEEPAKASGAGPGADKALAETRQVLDHVERALLWLLEGQRRKEQKWGVPGGDCCSHSGER